MRVCLCVCMCFNLFGYGNNSGKSDHRSHMALRARRVEGVSERRRYCGGRGVCVYVFVCYREIIVFYNYVQFESE